MYVELNYFLRCVCARKLTCLYKYPNCRRASSKTDSVQTTEISFVASAVRLYVSLHACTYTKSVRVCVAAAHRLMIIM